MMELTDLEVICAQWAQKKLGQKYKTLVALDTKELTIKKDQETYHEKSMKENVTVTTSKQTLENSMDTAREDEISVGDTSRSSCRWSLTKGLRLSADVSVTVGLPAITGLTAKAGMQFQLTGTKTTTEETEDSHSHKTTVPLPPHSKVNVSIVTKKKVQTMTFTLEVLLQGTVSVQMKKSKGDIKTAEGDVVDIFEKCGKPETFKIEEDPNGKKRVRLTIEGTFEGVRTIDRKVHSTTEDEDSPNQPANQVQQAPETIPPPDGLEAVETGNYSITLKWKSVESAQVIGYRLERSIAFGKLWKTAHNTRQLPVLPLKPTKFEVGGLVPYEAYHFRIKSAVDIDDCLVFGNGSKPLHVVAKVQYQPYPPRFVKVTDVTQESVSLSWTQPNPADDVSPDSCEYIVEIGRCVDGKIQNWAKRCRTTQQMCEVSIQQNGTYRFRVSAHNKEKAVSSLPEEMGDPEISIHIETTSEWFTTSQWLKTLWPFPDSRPVSQRQGSIIFVISCHDLSGLRELWMNYKLGRLKTFFQDLFARHAHPARRVTDTELNIRVDPKDFYACRRHLLLTCTDDRGFRMVTLGDSHSKGTTQQVHSEDYPVYCKPISHRTACPQLDYLDPAVSCTDSTEGHQQTDEQEIEALRNKVTRLTQKEMAAQQHNRRLEEQVRRLEAQLQIKQEQMKTAREDTKALIDRLTQEVSRLKQKEEQAQNILLDKKQEIQELQGANKSMEATIEELLYEKHTAKGGSQGKDPGMVKEPRKEEGTVKEEDPRKHGGPGMAKDLGKVQHPVIQGEELGMANDPRREQEPGKGGDPGTTKETKMARDPGKGKEGPVKEEDPGKQEVPEEKHSGEGEDLRTAEGKGMPKDTGKAEKEGGREEGPMKEEDAWKGEVEETSTESLRKQLLERTLELERTLFTGDSAPLLDPAQFQKAREDFLSYKAYVLEVTADLVPGTVQGQSSEDLESAKMPAGKSESNSVLLVNNEYGWSKGGISTINRQLAQLLSGAGRKVHCTVLEATEADRRDAAADGVELILPTSSPGDTRKPCPEWLTFDHHTRYHRLPQDVGWIVGHVDATSRAAAAIKEQRFPQADLSLIIHGLPEDTEHFMEKEMTTLQDVEKADTIFSVGHYIYDHFTNMLRAIPGDKRPTHYLFLPEPSDLFKKATMEHRDTKDKVILSVFGADNAERMGGYKLAAKAIARVVERSQKKIQWRIGGASEEEYQACKDILKTSIASDKLILRSQDEIRQDMQQANLVLMPSRTETFSLFGLEAMAAGVPVLVSDRSGLADLISEVIPEFHHSVLQIEGDDSVDVGRWADQIDNVLRNSKAEFSRAAALKQILLKSRYWEESHHHFLKACGCTVPDLPVRLHLDVMQGTPAGKLSDIVVKFQEMERELLTPDVFQDPRIYKEAQEFLLSHKAFLKEIQFG